MTAQVRTQLVPSVTTATELIVNAALGGVNRTGRMTTDNLARQMLAAGPIASATSTLLSAVSAHYIKPTKAALLAQAGTTDGEIGLVVLDAPELNGTYEKLSGVWQRQGPLPADAASTAAAAAEASRIAAALSEAAAETAAAAFDDIPWAHITSGKPTSLSGYGITDGLTAAYAATTYAALAANQTFAGIVGFANSPTAPTPETTDNSTHVATTAWVTGKIAASTAGVSQFNGRPGAVTLTSSDVTDALTYTPFASSGGALTGPVSSTDVFSFKSGSTIWGYVGTISIFGAAGTNMLRIRGDAGIMFGALGQPAMTIDTANLVSLVKMPRIGVTSAEIGTETSQHFGGVTIQVPPQRYKVRDWMADGIPTGVAATDDVSIAAAMAAALAAGGNRIVELPAGEIGTVGIAIDVPSRSGMTLIGAGDEATYLRNSNATSHDIVIGNPAYAIRNVVLEGFSLYPSVTKTSGAGVLINDAQILEIAIKIKGGFDGYHYENYGDQAQCDMWAPHITGLVNDGWVIGKSNDLFVNGLRVHGGGVFQGRRAATIYRASGLWFDNHESYQAAGDAWVFEPTGIGIQGGWFRGCLADSAGGRGWVFGGAGGGPIAEIFLSHSQASSCGSHGIETESSVNLNGLYVDTPLLSANGAHGGRHAAGRNIRYRDGEGSYNAVNGLSFEANVSEWSVMGMTLGHVGWAAAKSLSARQQNGVFVATGGSADKFMVVHNVFAGHLNAGYSGPAASSTRIIAPNLSY